MGIVRLFAVSFVALILTTGTAYPSRLSIPEAEKQAQVMRDTAYAKAAELRELRKTLHSWWGAQETVNRLQALYYKIATIKYLAQLTFENENSSANAVYDSKHVEKQLLESMKHVAARIPVALASVKPTISHTELLRAADHWSWAKNYLIRAVRLQELVTANHKTNLYHQKISETVEDARIEEGWAHDEYVAMLGVLRYTDDISIDMGLYYSLQAANDYLAQVVRDEEERIEALKSAERNGADEVFNRYLVVLMKSFCRKNC